MKRQIACLVLAMSAGCEEARQRPPEVEMPPGEQATRTIVTLQPDGPPTVKVEVISQETLRADFEAREQLKNGVGVARQAISSGSCGWADLWILDSTGNTLGSPPFN